MHFLFLADIWGKWNFIRNELNLRVGRNRMYITEPLAEHMYIHTYKHTYRIIFQKGNRKHSCSFSTSLVILIGISHKGSLCNYRWPSSLHHSPASDITDNRWIACTFHTAPFSPGFPSLARGLHGDSVLLAFAQFFCFIFNVLDYCCFNTLLFKARRLKFTWTEPVGWTKMLVLKQ